MTRHGAQRIILLASLTLAGCSTSTSPSAPTSVTVTGRVPPIGQTSQLTATALLPGGSSQNVTAQATWSSSDVTICTVTPAGLLTVLQPGDANVTAAYQGVSGQLTLSLALTTLTVTGGTLVTVCGSPTNACPGRTTQLSATATLADGAANDVTALATWSSSNPSIAAVGAGLVTAASPGSAIITASYQSDSATLAVQVAPPSP